MHEAIITINKIEFAHDDSETGQGQGQGQGQPYISSTVYRLEFEGEPDFTADPVTNTDAVITFPGLVNIEQLCGQPDNER